jgi:hypothetical protein
VLTLCVVLIVSQSFARQAHGQSAPTDTVDRLTAPIALYPDALIAQILMASTNVKALQSFSTWLSSNSSLKGSDLQSAAEKAGYGASYIALAPFPQVVQMMDQKLDWTTKLGQAFTNDKESVFASIQRLRLQAQSAGNLKSTPQQQVQSETTSSGEKVIVIQPTNPQVVYVPQYNPQTVYVTQPAPAPSAASVGVAAAIGFTAGIIIGASSNNYYYGPYGWRGAAMYNEAWEDRYDYLEERQENRLEYMENRQERFQENAPQRQANQAQRQSTAQANQAQRQSTAQANQAQRQSTAQANQAQRQASVQDRQAQSSANQAQRQAAMQDRQAQVETGQGQRQSSAAAPQRSSQWGSGRSTAAATSSYGGSGASHRSGMSSGGFGGYQSGSATRAESSRGSRSMSSSRGGGGRRR